MRRLFLLIPFIVAACNSNHHNFSIIGEIENYQQKKLYLSHLTMDRINKIDSVVLDDEGSFEFNGYTEVCDFYILQTVDDKYITLIIKPGDEVKVYAPDRHIDQGYQIEGSNDSKMVKSLNVRLRKSIYRIDSINRVYRSNMKNPRLPQIKTKLDSIYESILSGHREFTISFIDQNLNSLVSLMALYQQITPNRYVLSPLDDIRYFEKVDSSLYALYPESDAVRNLHREVIRNRERIKNKARTGSAITTGSVAPDIALPDPQGDTIRLSSVRARYILVDFWASWCQPCREENPNLVENYHAYQDKGFEIYQVSLDRNREAWLQGIREDELNWIHVSDLKYWNAAVVSLYGITSIPANYLVNRNRRVVAKNLRGEELEETLENVFK